VDIIRFSRPKQGIPPTPPPVTVGPDNLLLAVIHGDGPQGWRNPEALNTYLLKNAVGNNLTPESKKAAQAAAGGKVRPVRLRGDVIQQRLAGQSGYIFWTGADYAWLALGSPRPMNRMNRRPTTQIH